MSEPHRRLAGFRALPDVAGARLGGSVVYANDEFYAEAFNLITTLPAAHDPAAFGRRGEPKGSPSFWPTFFCIPSVTPGPFSPGAEAPRRQPVMASKVLESVGHGG